MTPRETETAIKRITRRRGRVAAQDDAQTVAWHGPVRAPTVHRVRV